MVRQNKKLKTFESNFIGQSYFGNDEQQILVIFHPINKDFTTFTDLLDTIAEWESKGLSSDYPTFTLKNVVSFFCLRIRSMGTRFKHRVYCKRLFI